MARIPNFTIRTPWAWVGKYVPPQADLSLAWAQDLDRCDLCGILWPTYAGPWGPNLAPFDGGTSPYMGLLSSLLGVEEAQSFCPACLEGIEYQADQAAPGWRVEAGQDVYLDLDQVDLGAVVHLYHGQAEVAPW